MANDQQVPLLTSITSTQLLADLLSPDNAQAWGQFDSCYRPEIWAIARKRGLNEDAAEDAAQQTLLELFKNYRAHKYERSNGRSRRRLSGIARRQISNLRRNMPLEFQVLDSASHTNVFERQEDPEGDAHLDDVELAEWRRGIYEEAMTRIRQQFDGRTVRAFELHGLEGRAAKDVVAELWVSENAVFLAKHKIVKRIQELLPQLEDTW